MKWKLEIDSDYPPIQIIANTEVLLLESYCIQTAAATYRSYEISSTTKDVSLSSAPPLEGAV